MGYVKLNRFGNKEQLVACKANKNGFPVGYLEIGSKLYKVEPAQASSGKTDKNGREILEWVKVTEMPKRQGSNGGKLKM